MWYKYVYMYTHIHVCIYDLYLYIIFHTVLYNNHCTYITKMILKICCKKLFWSRKISYKKMHIKKNYSNIIEIYCFAWCSIEFIYQNKLLCCTIDSLRKCLKPIVNSVARTKSLGWSYRREFTFKPNRDFVGFFVTPRGSERGEEGEGEGVDWLARIYCSVLLIFIGLMLPPCSPRYPRAFTPVSRRRTPAKQ